MNTLEINYIMSKNPVTKNFFNGVYPIDMLKFIEEKPQLIICNTDSSQEDGKHWILIYFHENNEVDFFDSLGNKPSYYGREFLDFMKKFASVCFFTPMRMQPINSNLCGHYCCYYAHKRCQGFKMKYILNNFPSSHVVKLFSKIYLRNYEIMKDEKYQKCIDL